MAWMEFFAVTVLGATLFEMKDAMGTVGSIITDQRILRLLMDNIQPEELQQKHRRVVVGYQ